MSTATQTRELLPEVEAFLSRGTLGGFVGGEEVQAASGDTFETHDPGSGEVLATVTHFQAEDVDRAVDAAARAFQEAAWARLPQPERSVHLHRLADEIENRKAIFAQIESLDAGKVYGQAEGDIQNVVDTLRYYADVAQHVQPRQVLAVRGHEAWTVRHPWGPCGFIVPWNFPLLLVGWGVSPALAAGNTVVIKPAEDTPLSALYLAQVANEIGFPPGVINVVPGLGETAGAALSGNAKLRRMSFTGSPEVGRKIASVCGENLVPVKCELGGKGAAVVFDDVDIADTAEKLVGAITFHTGQVCCDATRWLIHESIYDELVDECVVRLKSVQVGYQLDDQTQMGPVVNEKQRERINRYLEIGQREGAEMVLEGGTTSIEGRNGHFVSPALMAGSLDNTAAREEIFGPVAYLARFSSEDEGVRLANDTDYGLANSVWTKDLARAQRVAEAFEAGNSWINAHNVFAHGIPYAGINKSGVNGGVLSVETLFDYWRSVSVVRPSGA